LIDWYEEARRWVGSPMYAAYLACMFYAMDGGDYAGLAMWERVTLRYQAMWGRLEI
jgi:hypothetical protein